MARKTVYVAPQASGESLDGDVTWAFSSSDVAATLIDESPTANDSDAFWNYTSGVNYVACDWTVDLSSVPAGAENVDVTLVWRAKVTGAGWNQQTLPYLGLKQLGVYPTNALLSGQRVAGTLTGSYATFTEYFQGVNVAKLRLMDSLQLYFDSFAASAFVYTSQYVIKVEYDEPDAGVTVCVMM